MIPPPRMSHFESFMVYTTETGGTMTVCWATREQYEEVKERGKINIAPPCWAEPEWVDLKMVAFAPLGELRDFVLDPVKASA